MKSLPPHVSHILLLFLSFDVPNRHLAARFLTCREGFTSQAHARLHRVETPTRGDSSPRLIIWGV